MWKTNFKSCNISTCQNILFRFVWKLYHSLCYQILTTFECRFDLFTKSINRILNFLVNFEWDDIMEYLEGSEVMRWSSSIKYLSFYQLHAVSCALLGRQREPSVKTLHSPFSAEFWRHCVLSGRTQRRASSTPERRNGDINLNKYFISSSGDRTHNQSVLQSHFVPLRHAWPQKNNNNETKN